MEHPTTDEPIELKTKPERVIIFQEGAQVTRSGKKRLDSGAITVKIGGIPAAVDTQSIRVKGTGPGQILNMVVKRAYAQNEQPGRARDIIDQVKALTKEQRGIDDAIATKETALAQFKQSLAGSTGKFALFSATGKSTFTTYGELEVTLSGKIEASIDEISGLQKSKKDVVKRIAILQKEFEKLRARQGTVESTEIFLDLEVKKAGEFDFVISYVFKSSSQARWQPFYEINLHEEAEDASLKMNGLVTNKTGEDWLDITLALSTANIRPVSIQEPSPYIIRAHKPMPQVRAASTPMAAPSRGMLFKAKKEMFKADEMAGAGDDFAATGEEKEEEAEMPSVEIMDMDTNIATEAEVHEGVGIQVYEIGGKVSVPNGKDSGPFFLKEFKFKSELELYWSSAQGEMVVSRNIVENGGQVLLPGSMRTYIDDEFAGESRLDLVRPFEKFKTGVRESKVIKIKKELVDRGAKKGGAVVKDKIVRHFGYKIKIELLEDIGAKLVAQDAVPISDSTRITVSEVKYSKDPDKNVSGVITWNIDTKGVKKLDITYEFDITYNRGVEITPPLP